MNRRPLLTALLVVLSATSLFALTDNECHPDCYGHEAGDKVQDPWNCTQFYVCVYEGRPSDHAVVCPTGSVFDPLMGECVPGNFCEASCKPMCHMTCTTNLDMIQDPQNCNAYYMCDPELNPVGPYYCPDDRPYFDGEKCIDDTIRCCKTPCTPYCYSDTPAPDPTDCTRFYFCTSEGPVDENLHFPCNEGSTFQYTLGKCVEGAPCVTLCDV